MNKRKLTRTEELRSFYARLVTGSAGVQKERIFAAFNAVPREKFVGKWPWKVWASASYIDTPSADLSYVYQNVLIALVAAEGINNGEPGAHAFWLAALNPAVGETVLHIGAGTGYYTAILAHLVGSAGRVIAYEINPALAKAAKANLADIPSIQVKRRSGTAGRLPLADAIYVNAGATHPPDIWLDALKPRGRLLFPLTPSRTGAAHPGRSGGMLLVTRGDGAEFAAKFVSGAAFIGCIGARDDEASEALSAAFKRGDMSSVRSLRRGAVPDQSCWYAGSGWWLSTAPPPPESVGIRPSK